VIAEVSLKVLPRPPAEATLRIDGIDEDTARTRLNAWAAQPLPLNASCWVDRTLWLRLRGARAAVAEAAPRLGATVVDAGAAPWVALREQSHGFFEGGTQAAPSLWRVSVPDTAPSLDLGPTLVEWGGAQRWLWRPAGDAQAVRAAAARAGGHATLWRGAEGESRAEAFTAPAGAIAAIHERLRREFDPAGIFDAARANLGG
jgi:glycolate oxidase FAD binding subunit